MASEWVKTEIANARQKEIDTSKRVLFPIRLVDFDTIKRWKAFDADTGKDSARELRETRKMRTRSMAAEFALFRSLISSGSSPCDRGEEGA